MKQDKVFSEKMSDIKSFEFNEAVADVFDDMVSRSIPFYHEIHRIITDILERTYFEDGLIYDLGCSTGSTIELMDKFLTNKGFAPKFVGVDLSGPMLERSQKKLSHIPSDRLTLLKEDVTKLNFDPSKMIVMNYTLQFLNLKERQRLLESIYEALEPGGIFILAEKINCKDSTVHDLLTELYYDFKRRNGYSELEISQKREALENVLVPVTPEEQLKMLELAGFQKADMLFRWYNFSCYIGIK